MISKTADPEFENKGSAGRRGWEGVLNAWDHIGKLRKQEDYEALRLRELVEEDDAPGDNYENN